MNSDSSQKRALLMRVAERVCAIDLSHVVETLRPLPLGQVTGAPEIVCGVSIIRGHPVPVLGLWTLFGLPAIVPKRLVLIRAGTRLVAIAVEAVVGIIAVDPVVFEAMPPLLSKAAAGAIDAIGALDSELLYVLNTASLVPEAVWSSMDARES